MSKYISTKDFGCNFSVAYKQWKADTHCNLLHGYALGFSFEFETTELDHRNWAVDFGSLKSFKHFLEDHFDHTTLIAQDDPDLPIFEDLHKRKICKLVVVEKVGCEGLAAFLAEYLTEIWLPENGYAGRIKVRKVEVRETGSNSAMWVADHV